MRPIVKQELKSRAQWGGCRRIHREHSTAAGAGKGIDGKQLDALCAEMVALQKKVAAMQSAAADEQLNEGVDQLRAASSALATAVESFRAAAGTSVPEPAAQPAPAPDESAASPSEMFDLEAGIRWPSKLSADVRNTAPFWEQRPRDTRKGAASHLGGASATDCI